MAHVTVYVWMASSGKNYMLGKGHGAVEVGTPEGNLYYISLFGRRGGHVSLAPSDTPKADANAGTGFAKIRDERTGKVIDNPILDAYGPMSYQRDGERFGERLAQQQGLQRYHVPANHTFDVPIRSPGHQNLFGVSVHRMERFWTRFLNLPPGHKKRRYAMLSTHNNCNGVVVDALLEGGLQCYAGPPINFIYQDARTLVQWVEKATSRIKQMNAMDRAVRGQGHGSSGLLPWRTVPTLKEWKKVSDKGIAFYARRKDQVAKIDWTLDQYHRVGPKHTGCRLMLLQVILYYICSHLSRKPNSDRREAVLNLYPPVRAAFEALWRERDGGDVTTNFNSDPSLEDSEIGNRGYGLAPGDEDSEGGEGFIGGNLTD